MRSFIRRFAVLVLCCAVLSAGMSALAAEKTLDVTYVRITGEEFVADTLNGVEARYNLYGKTYYCNELVIRYYSEVYGLTVRTGDGGPKVQDNEAYWFELAETPQPGDVLYGSAARRGKGYSHWALVKSYDAETGVMTLIEQNWRWNGQAGVERKLAFPNSVYDCYTLRCAAGSVKTIHEREVEASWASDAIRAAEDAGVFAHYGSFAEAATREQFCEMVVNLVVSAGGVLTDGDMDSYCEKAYAMGLLSGASDGQLHPESSLTREQAAVILARAYSLMGILPQADTQTLAQFADSDEIGAWAADAVAEMVACGILQGGSDGLLHPGATLSVAETVTIAMRAGAALRVQADINSLMPSVMTYAAQGDTMRALSGLDA